MTVFRYLKKHRAELLEDLKLIGILTAAALLNSLIVGGCPIRAFTGIPCLGCGMARALAELVQLHFKASFAYHPLALAMPVFFLLWLARRQLRADQKKKILICAVVLFAVTYIIRILTHDPVLTVDIRKGILYRLAHFILILIH